MQKKKRLKILFLPSWHPSEKNSVAGIFIKEHAKAVSLYDEVVVLYNEGCDKRLKKKWEIIFDKEEEEIRTIRIRHRKSPIPKTTYFIYLWSIKQAFKKMLKEGWKPDVIHAHVYSAGVPAVIIGKEYKIPVVITEHFSGFPRHTLNGIEVFKTRFALNRADIVLPVSKNLQKHIESYGIKNRFEIIPNVVNLNDFYSLVKKGKDKNQPKKILTVALLVPVKGIPFLLKALANLKTKRQNFFLDIVGDGLSRQEYEELTEKLGLQNLVKFHGLRTKKEVAEFMRNCDFFVQPSLYETFGVTFIEAMACGKPVIATNIGGPKEFISKEIGILVPPKDIDAIEKAIDYMLDHHQDYSSNRLVQCVQRNFSYEVVGKKIDTIYREVLQSHFSK